MNEHLISEFQQLGVDEKSAVLALHVYLELCKANDLLELTDTMAKHLKVNKRDKLDAVLKKNRKFIEQAALLGVSVTTSREKDKNYTFHKDGRHESWGVGRRSGINQHICIMRHLDPSRSRIISDIMDSS